MSNLRLPLLAAVTALNLGWTLTAPAASPASTSEPVVQLEPYNVRMSYSTIEVRFRLSGANLFSPGDDSVQEARVVAVRFDEEGDDAGLKAHDVLLAVNGRKITGLTLREIAAVVAGARREPRQIWQVRRGLAVIHILHNGAWTPALPGLDR